MAQFDIRGSAVVGAGPARDGIVRDMNLRVARKARSYRIEAGRGCGVNPGFVGAGLARETGSPVIT